MSMKNDDWDFDGESHRGKKYPSGAPVVFVLPCAIIILSAIGYLVIRFLMAL